MRRAHTPRSFAVLRVFSRLVPYGPGAYGELLGYFLMSAALKHAFENLRLTWGQSAMSDEAGLGLFDFLVNGLVFGQSLHGEGDGRAASRREHW